MGEKVVKKEKLDKDYDELNLLISNLYDIVEKFGIIDPDENIQRFYSGDLGSDLKLYISKSNRKENKNLIVSKGVVTHGGIEIFEFEKGIITWDKNLTMEEVRKAIDKIDEFANRAGLLDINGQRKNISFINKNTGVYKVDDVFKKKGMAFMVSRGQNPENMLKMFDQPEKLIIVRKPFGLFIQLKEDLGYMEKREKIVRQLLEEKGIKIEDVKNVSWDTIRELRKEIDIRLGKDYVQS